ncbi:Ca2+-dependent phosphoinositide-specific phospholipase C [Aestuariibacter sp. A3R04]|uniref:Ca2+-dependent phosphoinositide-specific phospholipase C n=1 Tax=Aestuariibacter sp. A3R04 TaxID=2841571 RepID=UPI001C092A99|nr:Ca2+-dependent phosphoinositide-specific phospholipase C [Aestuariibacter sp. A3R04]MBU3020575.1 phosphatidylinositol-specific phospholipase C1-like protein [Aestuariibacter sp. A3R04]
MFYRLILLFSVFMNNVAAAPLNHYQWIGSHNSYKQALPASAFRFLAEKDSHRAAQIDYAHPSLATQLDLGIRQLEIDVVNDPNGNQYHIPELAARLNEQWLTENARHRLAKPGFKVLHIPHVDVRSHCIEFTSCLSQLVAWSDANPSHFPIVIMMNVKENQPAFLSSPPPALFDEKAFAALDTAIKDTLQQRLVTPASIQGKFDSLREAIVQQGWPDVNELKGKFLFLFDGNAEQRRRYLRGQPSLTQQAMFASFDPDHPSAAIMIKNNPVDQQADIRALVARGFMVRTRSDANFSAPDSVKAAQREAAFRSGAQMISTDFYPQSPQAKRHGYQVSFVDGALRRPHPFIPK